MSQTPTPGHVYRKTFEAHPGVVISRRVDCIRRCRPGWGTDSVTFTEWGNGFAGEKQEEVPLQIWNEWASAVENVGLTEETK